MLNRILSIVAALCLLAMMAITMADAVGRYFLNAPIDGASEIIGYLLGYTVFAALPVITSQGGHIEVGIFAARLPGGLRRAERFLTVAATIGGFAYVTWLLWQQAGRMQASGVLLGYFDVPAAPLIYPIVGLAGIAALVLLFDVFRRSAGAQER